MDLTKKEIEYFEKEIGPKLNELLDALLEPIFKQILEVDKRIYTMMYILHSKGILTEQDMKYIKEWPEENKEVKDETKETN